MKSRIVGTLVALSLLAGVLAPGAAHAAAYYNISVVRTTAYAGSNTWRFVEFSDSSMATKCGNLVHYDESATGGKAMAAMMMAAILTGRKVDVFINDTDASGRTDNCSIYEVYLHNY